VVERLLNYTTCTGLAHPPSLAIVILGKPQIRLTRGAPLFCGISVFLKVAYYISFLKCAKLLLNTGIGIATVTVTENN
jgi:hypothetical protein